MKEGGEKWGKREIIFGDRVRWGWEGKWERLFGVGEGTHRQTIIKLTSKEYTIPPAHSECII